ncbi:MAG: hypothetical protein LBF49_03565 [Puniceicoccales bacterium]|jgi:hypothetical protein|nr:hypothetical protein [Puniceicoccales bacterium]
MIPHTIHGSHARTLNIAEKTENAEATVGRPKKRSKELRISREVDMGARIAGKRLQDRSCTMESRATTKASRSSNSGTEHLGSGGEITGRSHVLAVERATVVYGFKELKICSPAKEIGLISLAGRLQSESPEMLLEIFKNCQWLKGKVKDEFIYDVAILSIKMELDKIFDQAQLEDIQKGVRPTRVLLASRVFDEDAGTILSDLTVFDGIHEKFFEWLDKNGEPPAKDLEISLPPRTRQLIAREPGTSSFVQCGMWHEWIRGDTSYLRDVVNDHVLLNSKRVSSKPPPIWEDPFFARVLADGIYGVDDYNRWQARDKNFGAKCQGIAPYIAASYAYTQLILRHVKLPGQTDEDPPSLHAIRMVNSDGADFLFGEDFLTSFETSKKCVYRCDNAKSAESWALLSPAENNSYGDVGIYGQIPIYSIASGFFSIKGAHSIQKELMVLPLADLDVTVEKKMSAPRFYEETVIPIIEVQYEGDAYVAKEIQEAKKLLEKRKKEMNLPG